MPYPSFSDPDQEIAAVFNGRSPSPRPPSTTKGKLVYLKQGGYASERKLSEDIGRYAR